MKNISELIAEGVLKIAEKASGNPAGLDGLEHYTLGFAVKDYPAWTPGAWNRVYEALGVSCRNVRLVGNPEIASELAAILKRDPQYLGGDVGVGFKDEMSRYLDSHELVARQIGSINLIKKFPNGKLEGFNTDGPGFAEVIEEWFQVGNQSPAGKKAVVLGAGGTASAIAFALAVKGVRVVILNRTVEKAEALAKRINSFFGGKRASYGGRRKDEMKKALVNAALVVAAIDEVSIPMERHVALGEIILPLSDESILRNRETAETLMEFLPKKALIVDVLVREEPTATLVLAAERGFETMDGKPMLVRQGRKAFYLLHRELLVSKGVDEAGLQKLMS